MHERAGFIGPASLMSPEHASEKNGLDNVARGLGQLLVLTRSLCHQSLYCHWQATEPEFTGLHSMFEQHYQSLRKATDILADRIDELGYELPSQFSGASWGSKQNDFPCQKEMILSMIYKHRLCAREAKKLAGTADESGDSISAHIAAQREEAHTRAAWLLTALIDSRVTHSLM